MGLDTHLPHLPPPSPTYLQLTTQTVIDLLNSGQPPLLKGETSLMPFPTVMMPPRVLIGSKTYYALPNMTMYSGYLSQRGSSWGPTGALLAGNYVGAQGSAEPHVDAEVGQRGQPS